MIQSFKDYFDQQVQHRHRHPLVRDPGMRKHAQTVPTYVKPKTTPKKYNDFKKNGNNSTSSLTSLDKRKLQKTFNVSKLPINKVKGLKRTGVGMVRRPNGSVQLVKTNVNSTLQR